VGAKDYRTHASEPSCRHLLHPEGAAAAADGRHAPTAPPLFGDEPTRLRAEPMLAGRHLDYALAMGFSTTAIGPVPGTVIKPFGQLLRNREASFWALQTLGWSAFFIAQYVAALVNPEELQQYGHLSAYNYVLLVAAVSGFVLTSCLRYAYRRVRDRSPMLVVATVLVLVYSSGLIWRVFINGAYAVFMERPEMLDSWQRIAASALISDYLLLSWSALYFGIYYFESAQREREATLREKALAQEAQMKMLRYQLNPHFLFNTLNAISTLVLDRDNDRANLAVTRLSAFLRHTLDQDPMKKVTLKQELEALDLYLGIEKLRFGPRLRLQLDIDQAALAALVPSLLLQPLIENALKYAVAPSETGGTLHLGARVIGQRLLLYVADDGPGLAEGAAVGGLGVGLRNTQERLAVLYGERARLAHHNTNPGFRVDIEFPAEHAP
jgi:two-component system, LytTR family, sensor kinase